MYSNGSFKEAVATFLKNLEMKAHFGWNQAVPCIRIWTRASIHHYYT